MLSALTEIKELIATTNNGKLLIFNIPNDIRKFVPILIKRGYLKKATFMRPGDAVKNI